MTCVAGIVDNGVVWLGGDSAGVTGWQLTVRADPKVFVRGPYVIGFTSSFRMGDLLRYVFDPPPPPEPTADLREFMVTSFIGALRTCLKDGGWASKENEHEQGGEFLTGVSGRLFHVDSDYQVGEPADRYMAVGCGAQVAHGALFATADSGMSPRERLSVALGAAERHSTDVRGPFAYEHGGWAGAK